MKMCLWILCIVFPLFYNSLGVCGKPTRTNYIHPISKDKYNLILSFIKFEGKCDFPVTPTKVDSLSLSLYLSFSCGGWPVLGYYGNCHFLKRDIGISIKISSVFRIQTFCVEGKCKFYQRKFWVWGENWQYFGIFDIIIQKQGPVWTLKTNKSHLFLTFHVNLLCFFSCCLHFYAVITLWYIKF